MAPGAILTCTHRLLTLSILSAAALNAQSSEHELRPGLAKSLRFEGPHSGNLPHGWGGNPADTIFVDSNLAHGGKYSVRVERTANSSAQFTNIGKALPVGFKGSTITLRGYIRTADVAGWAGLWLRLDGDSGMISLDNMSNQQLRHPRMEAILRHLAPDA